MTQPVF